jgi:hypothetical protein
MPRSGPPADQAIRETAYYIWERAGRREMDDDSEDEEKVLAGRADANVPAMLTATCLAADHRPPCGGAAPRRGRRLTP